MIQTATFSFLRNLAKNNDREWFHAHKAGYEQAKQNVLDVAAQLIAAINTFDKTLGYPEPKKCLFRIARDTRFSYDKSPYKTNFGVIMNPDGSPRSNLSGYYMHVEPGQCFLSSGIYMPMPDTLKAVRTAIEEDFSEFLKILSQKELVRKIGDLSRDDDALSRVPKGFDKDSPAAEYLKLKHFYVMVAVSDKEMTATDFVKKAASLYKIMYPFNSFMNRVITRDM